MKKGGGKRKGSSFERWVSKELSLWITNGQRNDIFWRTHSSGAMGTVSRRKLEYGDIMSVDDLGKPLTDRYNIECRHGKCLNLKDLTYSPKGSSLIDLIVEGRKNAELSGRKPLWIFKEQTREVLVMMNCTLTNEVSFELIRGVPSSAYDNAYLKIYLYQKLESYRNTRH